jgi:hypothetical protein
LLLNHNSMLVNFLSLVLLAGLTAASLLVCLAKWGVLAAWEVKRPEWLMRRCDFCAGYWLSVGLLLAVVAAGLWWLGLAARRRCGRTGGGPASGGRMPGGGRGFGVIAYLTFLC